MKTRVTRSKSSPQPAGKQPAAAAPLQPDLVLSQALIQALQAESHHGGGFALVGPDGQHHPLSPTLVLVLERAATLIADGDAVTVVPIARELTTQQAADMLQVSRQYLVRLLDAGELPCRKTGAHRRLRVEDVTSYKAARDARRRVDLRLLTAISEQSGGYEGEPA